MAWAISSCFCFRPPQKHVFTRQVEDVEVGVHKSEFLVLEQPASAIFSGRFPPCRYNICAAPC